MPPRYTTPNVNQPLEQVVFPSLENQYISTFKYQKNHADSRVLLVFETLTIIDFH